MEKENGVKKIVIIGPESTGKTTLTNALAKHFNCPSVNEYAREYIDKLNRSYKEEDILTIAQKQIELEDKEQAPYLFIDTDLIVCKVWSEYKYGRCHPWILKQIKNRKYHHYLLCDIDLEWEQDPQRENPNDREKLFEIYKEELNKLNKSYSIVSGEKKDRLFNAIKNLSFL